MKGFHSLDICDTFDDVDRILDCLTRGCGMHLSSAHVTLSPKMLIASGSTLLAFDILYEEAFNNAVEHFNESCFQKVGISLCPTEVALQVAIL
mmetsp:Transcript_11747/g.23561  ORF Transcript_11747/g.23561 Transcript_11747/m.23561 type:complete len:93 (-) Transcript_11747:866-1144(-)